MYCHELAHVRQQTANRRGGVDAAQADFGLEIDPDPRLEREAEETAQRVMSGGELGIQRLAQTEVHVQRSVKNALSSVRDRFSKESESAQSQPQSQFREFDGGDLEETVGTLVENQQQLLKALEASQQSAVEKVGVEAGKGTMGALGGTLATSGGLVLGATVGSVLPGVGTTIGAVAGGATGKVVGGALGGAMGAVYERNFDDATQTLTDQTQQASTWLNQLIEEKVLSVLDRNNTGSGNTQADELGK
ncbi:DUF4157 domain-containing protein [Natrinema sp. 74]|uniref:DUF4157 domain-containing protein n=1 Tax=Natrinema sp. 74 TaxID=3384159 RepID=UPI0038D4DE30